jgi:hypothetical protein
MYSYYVQDANNRYVRHIMIVFKQFTALCDYVEDDIENYCEDDGEDDKVDTQTREMFRQKLDDGHENHILYYESPSMGYKFIICMLPVAG